MKLTTGEYDALLFLYAAYPVAFVALPQYIKDMFYERLHDKTV